jgi:hypothetical protein
MTAAAAAVCIPACICPARRLNECSFALRLAQQELLLLYSKMSPGWHSRALQIASRVDSRIAFALPFFKMEMLAIVMPTFSESSVTLIFLFANMTSMLMMIAMLVSSHR